MTPWARITVMTSTTDGLPWARWPWTGRCTQGLPPAPGFPYHGRCELKPGHPGPHALERGMDLVRFLT